MVPLASLELSFVLLLIKLKASSLTSWILPLLYLGFGFRCLLNFPSNGTITWTNVMSHLDRSAPWMWRCHEPKSLGRCKPCLFWVFLLVDFPNLFSSSYLLGAMSISATVMRLRNKWSLHHSQHIDRGSKTFMSYSQKNSTLRILRTSTGWDTTKDREVPCCSFM